MNPSRFDLARLPAGFHQHRFALGDVGFTAYIWRGGDGPVLLVNGATHGDEYEGPAVLRQWVNAWRPPALRGTVVLVPVLNEAAFWAGRRCHPVDGGNLARAFPGAPRGGPTARLAYLFENQLLAQCTHYADLHSAGAVKELEPWVGYMLAARGTNRTQRAMAACFDRFWCWAAPYLPRRTLSAAHRRRIPAIYVECRGAGGVDPRDLAALDAGLRHLLGQLGLAGSRPLRLRPQKCRIGRHARETHLQLHNRAGRDGMFQPAVRLGQTVRRGELLGYLHDLARPGAVAVRAEGGGRVVTLRRQRSVRRGDSLAAVVRI